MRWFAHTPSQRIQFENGRYRLLENREFTSMAGATATGLLGASIYLAYRIIRYHAGMSWLSLSTQSVLFLGLALGTQQLLSVNQMVVKEIFLLEDGKQVEIVTSGLLMKNRVKRIRVKEILSPEEHLETKLSMLQLQAWVVRTHKEMFLIPPTVTILDGELAQAVLRGEEINLSEQEDIEVIDIE